jgi:hypothetical protein
MPLTPALSPWGRGEGRDRREARPSLGLSPWGEGRVVTDEKPALRSASPRGERGG